MPMQKLREVLEQAQKNKVAVGHFNIGDDNILMGVFAAARELRVPVMVGVSEGESAFLGVRQVAALVKSLRDEFDFPIYLNADHTHSLAKALEAANAGFDSIVFDLSALPFDENVRQTRDAVQKLKAINPDILVEGEIGDIGTGSEIHATAPDLTKFRTLPTKRKNSSPPPASIFSRRPSATCTAWCKAWSKEKLKSISMSSASPR